MGRKAAQLILRRMKDPGDDAGADHYRRAMPLDLIARESTGPAPERKGG